MTTLAKDSKFAVYDIDYVENLLGNAPLGILISDQEGQVWYTNEFLDQIFGKEIYQEVSEINLFDLEWIKNSGLKNIFRELLENDQPFQDQRIRFKNFENKELHLSLRATPLKDQEGGRNGLICFVEDISEKAQLRNNLKDKSQELSIINEVSLALSTTLNTDQILEMILIGVTADQGLGFNRAFLLLLNEEKNHLVGKMALGTSNSQDAKKIWEELSKKKLTLKEVLRSYRKTTKQKDIEVKRIIENLKISMDDDENLLVQAVKKRSPINSMQILEHQSNRSLIKLLGTQKSAVVPLVIKDKAIGVIIADNFITSKSIKDEDVKLLQIFASQASIAIENSKLYNRLTQQVKSLKKTNNALAQNTKRMIMIEKFSTIGQITSRVAHQLRNPMTIIGGFAKSLLKKADPDDPKYNSLKIIAGQTEGMEKILNQLIDFTPKPRIELKKTDLNITIEQSLKIVEKELAQSGIILIKDLNKDLPSFLIDAEQLQVALVDIFGNSIQAMPFGGELKVSTREEGGQAKIEIKDKGTGIAEKDLKYIFEPFYTTRKNAEGLGLTIASEIIKNHHGQIWAESREKEETSIFINLPIRRGENQ